MHLDRPIRRLATQPISPVIAHADLVPEARFHLRVRHGVHFEGCFADEEAKHFDLRVEFYEGELDGLVVGEGGAEGAAGVRVEDGGADAVGGGAEGGGGLAEAIFVREGVGDGEAVVEGSEEGGVGGPEVEGDGGVVGGHVEGPGGVSLGVVYVCGFKHLSTCLYPTR